MASTFYAAVEHLFLVIFRSQSDDVRGEFPWNHPDDIGRHAYTPDLDAR